MKVSFKVELDHNKISELETTAIRNALEFTAEWLLTEVQAAGVVPKDTGELESTGFFSVVHDNLVSILYSGPQVRRLYYNPQFNFRTDRNPNAQGRWLDPWVFGDKSSDVKRKFAEFYADQIVEVFR